MPFCESCRAEYEDGTELCAECNQPLVDALPDSGSPSNMTDVYVCYDGRLAERVAELLVRDGIEVLIRDRTSSAFPTTVGETAMQIVAVDEASRPRARELIKAAVADGVVAADGKLID